MRALAILLVVVVVVGCSKPDKTGSPPGRSPAPGSLTQTRITRDWWEYTSKNHEFKVEFPWRGNQPTGRAATHEPVHVFMGDATAYCAERWENEKGKTYEFCIVAGQFKKTAPQAGRDDAVQKMVDYVNLPKGAKPSQPKAITWSKRPATETVYVGEEKAGQKPRVIIRKLLTGDWVYIGVVRDAGALSDSEAAQFFDSFEILPGTKPK